MIKNETTWASVEDAAELARDWNYEYLECRVNRHSWQQTDSVFIKKYQYFRVWTQCTRCDSKRYQECAKNGVPYMSQLTYSTGFLAKGLGRIAGDALGAVRVEMLNRNGLRTVRSTKEDDDTLPHSRITRRALGIPDVPQ
jgi:hypothetical protein